MLDFIANHWLWIIIINWVAAFVVYHLHYGERHAEM